MPNASFGALFDELKNWGRWGTSDELGALNFLTPDRVIAAARGIVQGRQISLSLPLDTVVGPDNPNPADHHMTSRLGEHPHLLEFACDYIGVEMHGDAHSHIDALCHAAFGGQLYNGYPAETVTDQGARKLSVDRCFRGIVGRGVMLDIPRLRGVPWLEPGEAIGPEELESAERGQGVRLGKGDVVLLRTGHNRRRRELGAWDAANGKAGLDVTSMALLRAREVSVLGSDGDGDAVPHRVEGVSHPIHALGITAMGLHFLDSLQLDELARACEEESRWDFFFTLAPLRVEGGTGAPVNPIAIF